MNYFDDYGDSRRKIPYDDMPITRNEKSSRSYNSSGGHARSGGVGKFPLIIISLVLVLNMILSVVCLYLIKTKKVRVINNYEIALSPSSAVSSVTALNASLSSVQVKTKNSAGAGIIYKIDWDKRIVYFVTCYHVVSGYEEATISHPSFESDLVAKRIGYSVTSDVAVLEYTVSKKSNNARDDVEWVLGDCREISWFDSAYVSQIETCFAFGNSLGFGLEVTDGVVSVVNDIASTENNKNGRFIRFSAEINPGNSGGGLFNVNGEFIGLVSAKIHYATSSDTGQFTVLGMSYAVPSSIVKGVADRVIAGEAYPQKIKLNIEFENLSGMTLTPVEYEGGSRIIEVYNVEISDINGSFSGILHEGDIVEKFSYTGYDDNTYEVQMYNKYSFDDHAYLVKKNTKITFYLSGGATFEVQASSLE